MRAIFPLENRLFGGLTNNIRCFDNDIFEFLNVDTWKTKGTNYYANIGRVEEEIL